MPLIKRIDPQKAPKFPSVLKTTGFNPNKLSRFYSSLPNIATNGGRDIVFIGDSLFEGVGVSDGSLYSWARLVGQNLQQWANRKWAPTVVGGVGYVQAYTSSSVTNTTVVNSGTFAGGTPASANGACGFGLIKADSRTAVTAGGTHGTLTWAGAGTITITASSGTWLTATPTIVVVGDFVNVTSATTTDRNGMYKITVVTATVITCTAVGTQVPTAGLDATAVLTFSGGSQLTMNYITDVDFVYGKRTVAVTAKYSATGTGATSGSITVGSTAKGPLWNTAAFTNNNTGINGERQALLSGMTASSTNTVLSIGFASTDSMRYNGFICYNGDRTAGLRYHNLGRSGWKLYGKDDATPANDNNTCIFRPDTPTNPILWDDADYEVNAAVKTAITANVDQWSYAASTDAATGVYAGSCRASLFVLELITNDQYYYGTVSAAAGLILFQAALQQIVDRIVSRPSAPAVLLVVPPAPAGRETNYRIFKQAVHNVALATSHVTVCDLDAYYTTTTRSLKFPRTWENDAVASEVHPTTLGAIHWASVITQAIQAGYLV